jgi:hypothetical protein
MQVAVACGTLKGGRGDWLVEKVAELGGASLLPLLTDRSPEVRFRFKFQSNLVWEFSKINQQLLLSGERRQGRPSRPRGSGGGEAVPAHARAAGGTLTQPRSKRD